VLIGLDIGHLVGEISSMRNPGENDIRLILSAPLRALSAKQILIMTVFGLVGVALFQMFQYLAYLLDGQSIRVVFEAYGPLYFGLPALVGLTGWIVWTVGLFLSVLAIMLGMFSVAAINVERLRGNRFMGIRETFKFALSRFSQILLAEITVGGFVLFITLIFALYGLIARVPWLGEWVYTLLFVIPGFVIAILIVFAMFVFLLMVLLLPAVAAADRKGETFGAIVESFSTVLREPTKWFGFTLYTLAAAKLASFVYAYFSYRAVQFMVGASGLGGGDRIERLVKAGLSHLPVRSDFVGETLNVFPGLDFGFSVDRWARSSSDELVGYVMAVMLFLIFASVIGYLLAVVATGQAHIYVWIRRLKDDYDVADEDPMFFTEPWANPKINGEPSTDSPSE